VAQKPKNRLESESRVVVARVGRSHGVKGWLRLQCFTDDPLSVLSYKPWFLKRADGWQEIKIEDARLADETLLVKFIGFDDCDAARTLTGGEIAVTRCQLPPCAEGEYYWADLENLSVVNEQGVELGIVESIFNAGADDLLQVRGKKVFLIPFRMDDVVKNVDLTARTITVAWNEDWA